MSGLQTLEVMQRRVSEGRSCQSNLRENGVTRSLPKLLVFLPMAQFWDMRSSDVSILEKYFVHWNGAWEEHSKQRLWSEWPAVTLSYR